MVWYRMQRKSLVPHARCPTPRSNACHKELQVLTHEVQGTGGLTGKLCMREGSNLMYNYLHCSGIPSWLTIAVRAWHKKCLKG